MRTVFIMGFFAVALAGCETNDQKCQSYGAEPGSQAYVQCMATLEAADRDRPIYVPPPAPVYIPPPIIR